MTTLEWLQVLKRDWIVCQEKLSPLVREECRLIRELVEDQKGIPTSKLPEAQVKVQTRATTELLLVFKVAILMLGECKYSQDVRKTFWQISSDIFELNDSLLPNLFTGVGYLTKGDDEFLDQEREFIESQIIPRIAVRKIHAKL